MGVQAWNRGAIHMQISIRVVVWGGIAIGDGGLKYGWVGGWVGGCLSWGVGGLFCLWGQLDAS